MNRLVIVVSDQYEAKQVQKYYRENVLIFALSLEAEFYLEKYIIGYKNPLYNFKNKNIYVSDLKYFIDNFRIARTWYKNPCFEYIQDKLGYFLFDLERSLDFAERVIRKIQPENIIIAKPKIFKGYSIVNNTLIQNAFVITASINNIRINFIKSKPRVHNLKQILGKFLKPLVRQKDSYKIGDIDVLFIIPPLKFLDLCGLVNSFKLSKIKVAYLTYNLTLENKRKLQKLKVPYFLKESFIDYELKYKAINDLEIISKKREWRNFYHKRYPRNGIVNNLARSKIRDIVENELLEVLIDQYLAKKVFYLFKPSSLLTLTDPDPKCLPYINEAKSLGIKTISLEHGGDFDPMPYSLPKSNKHITWSLLSKKKLLANNFTNYAKALERKRILLGQSPFHNLENITSRKTANKINILFLPTINYFDKGINYYYLRKLFSALGDSKLDIKLLIRPHPFQNPEDFREVFKRYQLQGEIANNISLKDVINISDVVIFENTTAAFDALLAGKPCVFFNPYTGKDFFNIGFLKASLTILNEDEINSRLINFLKNRIKWKEFSKKGKQFAKVYLGLENNYSKNKIVEATANILKFPD